MVQQPQQPPKPDDEKPSAPPTAPTPAQPSAPKPPTASDLKAQASAPPSEESKTDTTKTAPATPPTPSAAQPESPPSTSNASKDAEEHKVIPEPQVSTGTPNTGVREVRAAAQTTAASDQQQPPVPVERDVPELEARAAPDIRPPLSDDEIYVVLVDQLANAYQYGMQVSRAQLEGDGVAVDERERVGVLARLTSDDPRIGPALEARARSDAVMRRVHHDTGVILP